MIRKYISFCLCSLFSLASYAQVIEGSIKNSAGEPLISASIQVGNTFAITDINGNYILEEIDETVLARITYLGYETMELSIDVLRLNPHINLIEGDQILETMTITTSRYQKRLSETAVSVEVLKPELISSVNTVDIDDAIDKVSGVQMINGQANIRGGSGFSYGAGSRVMLLIDDIPALQVDAGFTNWGDIPVENIAQVEIVKGAASSLYGSAALNGIINIRTGEAKAEPVTKISAGYNAYLSPKDPLKKWWGDTSRYEYNLSILHKQKFGKLDVVGSIFHTKLESYNRLTFKSRWRGTAKLRYHLTDRLKVSINTLINRGDNGDFFLWRDGFENGYKPFPGTEAKQDNFRMYIDPLLTYYDKSNNRHRLQLRYHYIDNQNSTNQSNSSKTMYGEYQISRNFSSAQLEFTSGVVATNTNTNAALFGDTTFVTRTLALYTQVDKQITERFSLSGGVRYELNKQITPEEFNDIVVPNGEISDGRVVARFGTRYALNDYSAFRASWGQGYRFPTITERFISTVFGGFQISPNPDLLPEKGWTAELAYKQGFKLGAFKGYADLAFFTSQYQDMMEFLFLLKEFSFTATNVGDTQIDGGEFSIFGSVDLDIAELKLFGGYTRIFPKYKDFESNEAVKANLSTGQNVLKYRNEHSFKMDAQLDFKHFSIGGAVNYASHMVNIDRVLESIDLLDPPLDLVGLRAYRNINNNGFTRFDARASTAFKGAKFSLIVNNVLNSEYIVRPALLEAPRSVAVRIDWTL